MLYLLLSLLLVYKEMIGEAPAEDADAVIVTAPRDLKQVLKFFLGIYLDVSKYLFLIFNRCVTLNSMNVVN